MKFRTARAAGIALGVAFALTGTACSSVGPDAPAAEAQAPAFAGQHVDVAEFAAAAAVPGVMIVDVRTPEEFAAGHLLGAVNADVNSADFAGLIPCPRPRQGLRGVLPQRQPLPRGDRDDGGPGLHAHRRVEGGIAAWSAAGYVVVQ